MSINTGVWPYTSFAEAQKAAVSLDCRVGHFSDPEAVPGLAHFCEHMLFLGTKKYPKEGEYKEFLHQHGGMSIARVNII